MFHENFHIFLCGFTVGIRVRDIINPIIFSVINHVENLVQLAHIIKQKKT